MPQCKGEGGRVDRSSFFVWRKTGGISGLFCRIVPTRAILLLRSSSASSNEVKKLSHVSLEPLGHLQDHPHPLIYFGWFARCSPGVNLQPPGVRCFDVTGCPNLYAVFSRLFRNVLSETAPSFERYQLLIHRNVSVWAKQHHQAVCPHVPYLPKGSQFVGTACRSGELVVKSEGAGDVRKSFLGHRGPENAPSGFLTPKAGVGLVF